MGINFLINFQIIFFNMKYLYKYPYVKIVHGIRKSIIFNHINGDVFNLNSQFIPLTKLIDTHSISKLFKENDKNIVSHFISFFVQKKMGIVMEKSNFPNIPNLIPRYTYNQIEIVEIELSDFTINNFKSIHEKLNSLKCHTYFFILNDSLNKDIIEFLNKMSISFNLVINKCFPELISKCYLNEIYSNPALFFTYFRCWPKSIDIRPYSQWIKIINEYWKIQFTKNIYNISKIGHPYFHSRIFINKYGEYSNSYRDVTFLGDFINRPNQFVIKSLLTQKYWTIKREFITECQDCEFRYSCIDNSLPAPLELNNMYKLKTKCKFSPK